MSKIFLIKLTWNGPHISVSHTIVFGMDCGNSISREKKTLSYKERCDQQRKTYREQLAAEKQNRKTLVFIDESGFRSESFRRFGYALKGEPVSDLISSQRNRTTTLLAAPMDQAFTTPILLEGSCNTACFNVWLESQLCPQLGENHLVIMDNARIHKTKIYETL